MNFKILIFHFVQWKYEAEKMFLTKVFEKIVGNQYTLHWVPERVKY